MFVVIAIKSLLILGCLILTLGCRRAIKKEAKKTMYSYRLVALVGVVIFLGISVVLQLIRLWSVLRNPEYIDSGVWFYLLSDLTSEAGGVLLLTFIPAALFAIFLLVANIVLLVKEGVSLKNVLGILLGMFLVLGTIGMFNTYSFLDRLMNVHSYAGYCFSLAIENIWAIICVYIQSLMAATIYASAKAMRHAPKGAREYVMILGCYVRPDGKPGGALKRRIDTALDFARKQSKRTGVAPVLVLSGGRGSDENISEAEAMKRYIQSKKYTGRLIIEDESRTTQENFKFSRRKILEDAEQTKLLDRVVFATTDFHVFRSGVIASKLGFVRPEGIPAKSPWYFYYNALVREFIANLNSERKIHIFNVLVVAGSMSLIILVGYLFDLM